MQERVGLEQGHMHAQGLGAALRRAPVVTHRICAWCSSHSNSLCALGKMRADSALMACTR